MGPSGSTSQLKRLRFARSIYQLLDPYVALPCKKSSWGLSFESTSTSRRCRSTNWRTGFRSWPGKGTTAMCTAILIFTGKSCILYWRHRTSFSGRWTKRCMLARFFKEPSILQWLTAPRSTSLWRPSSSPNGTVRLLRCPQRWSTMKKKCILRPWVA